MSNPIPGQPDPQPVFAAPVGGPEAVPGQPVPGQPEPQPVYQPEAPQGYLPEAPVSYQAEAPRPSAPTTLAQMNAFAMVAIILAFIQPIAAIVFGHMGLSQIKRNGDAGRGLALTGLIIGYVMTVGAILAIISYFSFLFFIFAIAGAGMSEFNGYDNFGDSF